LGTTALTQRLLPALVAGSPSRVVFVSSGGMYTQPLCLKDLQHAKLQPWDGSAAYAKEKRCQVALAEHLAQAWADQGGCKEQRVRYCSHWDRDSSTHHQTSTCLLLCQTPNAASFCAS
jgi:NAD(P)-dependent dehydrogenase (short-subunit alcohol dehydrogenase family)